LDKVELRLPADSVKIDRSFIRDLDEASRSAIPVVQAILTLAHNLELKVVAEGVETEAQMRTLTNLKCDVIQGYLLHKPLDANTLARIFRQRALNRNDASLATTLSIA
jgi:EAL domain-containing protein (putative c-di-GMP-specific phosphodiesterase class I)